MDIRKYGCPFFCIPIFSCFDYIDAYYYSDLNTEAFFSKAFSKTSERMMTVTKSPVPVIVLCVTVVVLVMISFKWWKAKKKQKNIEAEHTQRILDTDLNEIHTPSPKISDLEDKYH